MSCLLGDKIRIFMSLKLSFCSPSIYDKSNSVLVCDDAFFNRNWAGACGRRWAGPGLFTNWAVGRWIVWAGVGLLQHWFAGSGNDASLQETRMKRGVGKGVARSRSDA